MTRLVPPTGSDDPWRVEVAQDGVTTQLEADHLWTTIPITVLARLIGEVCG